MRIQTKLRKKLFSKKNALFLTASLIFILKLLSYFYPEYINSDFWEYQNIPLSEEVKNCEFKIHYINVGKADCSLIKCGDSEILIDSGDVSSRNRVKSYLKRAGIKDIDLVIISHPDIDHIGQMSSVANSFPIKKVIASEIPDKLKPRNDTYRRMYETFSKKSIPVELAYPGQKIQLSDIQIEIISPKINYDSINNNSIVCKITYKNRSFLFVGDAEKEVEADLIADQANLKSDVLKVGHHGSKTSSSEDFLKKVDPKYAVISVGKNKHGLPKQEILNRLYELKIKTYRTDLDGTISLGSDGDKIYICTENAA